MESTSEIWGGLKCTQILLLFHRDIEAVSERLSSKKYQAPKVEETRYETEN